MVAVVLVIATVLMLTVAMAEVTRCLVAFTDSLIRFDALLMTIFALPLLVSLRLKGERACTCRMSYLNLLIGHR